MRINNKQLKSNTGLSFESFTDMIYYIENHLAYLKAHNKNYTKEQEHRIDDLYEIVMAIDPWNDETFGNDETEV